MLAGAMIDSLDRLYYCVVGIRHDGSRDPRYHNLSHETAVRVRSAMLQSRLYERVLIEDQRKRNRAARSG